MPDMDWWHSIPAMERVARRILTGAALFAGTALVTWPISWMIAAPFMIIAVTLAAFGLFFWFRLDDLRERGRFS